MMLSHELIFTMIYTAMIIAITVAQNAIDVIKIEVSNCIEKICM